MTEDEIEIAPDFTIGDWKALRSRLDRSGAWSEAWEEAISMVESRFRARFLEPADQLKKLAYAGFAVLALDCLLIESLEYFKSGKQTVPRRRKGDDRTSEDAFKNFLLKTEPFSQFFNEQTAVDFHKSVRNALLHDGETRNGWLVRLGSYDLVDRRHAPYVIINRDKFHDAVVKALSDHLEKLRQPSQNKLRENLYNAIEGLCERSLPGWRPASKRGLCGQR